MPPRKLQNVPTRAYQHAHSITGFARNVAKTTPQMRSADSMPDAGVDIEMRSMLSSTKKGYFYFHTSTELRTEPNTLGEHQNFHAYEN
jgi:hypothetical protein